MVLGSLWVTHLLRRQIADRGPGPEALRPHPTSISSSSSFHLGRCADRLGLQQIRLLVGPPGPGPAPLWTQAWGRPITVIVACSSRSTAR
jgi:hypothetical protein